MPLIAIRKAVQNLRVVDVREGAAGGVFCGEGETVEWRARSVGSPECQGGDPGPLGLELAQQLASVVRHSTEMSRITVRSGTGDPIVPPYGDRRVDRQGDCGRSFVVSGGVMLWTAADAAPATDYDVSLGGAATRTTG